MEPASAYLRCLAEYKFMKVLLEEFKSSLPTIEEIENELSK